MEKLSASETVAKINDPKEEIGTNWWVENIYTPESLDFDNENAAIAELSHPELGDDTIELPFTLSLYWDDDYPEEDPYPGIKEDDNLKAILKLVTLDSLEEVAHEYIKGSVEDNKEAHATRYLI